MDVMALWRIAIDGALVFSVGYLALRLWRTQPPSIPLVAMRELDSSLRVLIRDAEHASKNLSEDLTRKKRQLEEVLYELERAETRASEVLSRASIERRQQEVDARTDKGGRRREDHAHEQPHRSAQSSEPTPPLVEARSVSLEHSRTKQPVNIFGEPIGAPESTENPAPVQASAPLRHQIEVEKVAQVNEQTTKSLEDIYSAAEQMLRAGQSLEQVAALSALPVDEVQMLAQLIEREGSQNRSERVEIQRERQVL